MIQAKRILVPVDFSHESELALEWAVMLAMNMMGSSIELCHIHPPIAPVSPEPIAFDYEEALARERRSLEKKLEEFRYRIPEGISSSYVIGEGNVASEIERLCRQMSIDLVIMTTHGRRGLSRLLHGSTTEETVRLAPCPVLVLHLNDTMREAVGATCVKLGEGWR